MAEQILRSHEVDLVLLDVQMEDGTGFDLLDRFKTWHFNVIFTTAHDEFAVRAFRYHAIDYLLKPIAPEDLVEAVNNAKARSDNELRQKQFQHLLETTTNRSFDRLTLNTSTGPIFINTQEISHIETYGNYVFVFLVNNERHLVSRNLKEFEEMLPEPAFFRIHQSHMVNTAMVKKFEKDDGGYAVMKNGVKLPVARRRKEEFLKVLTGD
jgi:two-component system LytT family response regulator